MVAYSYGHPLVPYIKKMYFPETKHLHWEMYMHPFSW